ncbi:unnamed protein product [Microthlaspi erraticum]|uniref:GCK domain-containing protein n=1 Tax=Microthlaspi erraticum TaxID=1685480 RepID=A0A6D2JDR7_9BRAS|nr:unnamed protein product [Microthlaspi erraticum]
MSSTNPKAVTSETKAKTGNDPSTHQGGDSSATSQDPNISKTVSTENNLNQTNKEAEEDCEECSLRRFIKEGECKDIFIEVDNCVDDEDDVNKCRDASMKLMTCMFTNSDYYGPYLVAQKKALTQAYKTALEELEIAEEAMAVAKKKKEAEETEEN